MHRALFRPTVRQALVVLAIAAASVAYACTLRYFAIEHSATALACDAGGSSFLCAGRKIGLAFSQSGAFGMIALIAAALNLIRPSIVLTCLAALCGCFGLVLYNTATSALAVALLTLSLARPAPEPE